MPRVPELVERVRQVTLDQPATLGDGDCEALRAGLIGQPTNTFTSVAFVGVGAWLATRVPQLPRRSRNSALAYAALAAVTGAGSVAYHGPQFDGAQFFHDVPILGVLGIGVALPLWRLARGRTPLPGWSGRLGSTMAVGTVVAGAAYAAGGTDSPWCRPESLLQLHGVWHLGTAAVVGLWGLALWAPEHADADEPAEELTMAGGDDGAGG